jgi:hypothetical protein
MPLRDRPCRGKMPGNGPPNKNPRTATVGLERGIDRPISEMRCHRMIPAHAHRVGFSLKKQVRAAMECSLCRQ